MAGWQLLHAVPALPPSLAIGVGCHLRCASISTPAATPARAAHDRVRRRRVRRISSAALALRFDAARPTRIPHDRHVRFVGRRTMACSARRCAGLTGLRRDAGQSRAQGAGRRCSGRPAIAPVVEQSLDRTFRPLATGRCCSRMRTLSRSASAPRTATPGSIRRAADARSGLGYVGGPAGGVAFGIRNFWQSHPAQLDIRGAQERRREVTMWLWAPDAPPMDLRFYHDGLGQDTYEKQLEGARHHLRGLRARLRHAARRRAHQRTHAVDAAVDAERARSARTRADALRRTGSHGRRRPQTLHRSPASSAGTFSLPLATTPNTRRSRSSSTACSTSISDQQDQRRWYGFWNYGDVMHTYDSDRHVWRYDVGGFAWDNSELSTDLWLWHVLPAHRPRRHLPLRRGHDAPHRRSRRPPPRPLRPLGTRHDVHALGRQRQAAAHQHRAEPPLLLLPHRATNASATSCASRSRRRARCARSCPDRKLPGARDRVRDSPQRRLRAPGLRHRLGLARRRMVHRVGAHARPEMRDQARSRACGPSRAQPRGFFTGGARLNLSTRCFRHDAKDRQVSVSHLCVRRSACPSLRRADPVARRARVRAGLAAVLQLYNASAEEQRRRSEKVCGNVESSAGPLGLTAYAAHAKRDATIAGRAWEEFTRAAPASGRISSSNRSESPATMC